MLSLFAISCQDTKTTPKKEIEIKEKATVKTTKKPQKETSKIPNRIPPITDKTVREFYTAYGAVNKEQKVRIKTHFGDIDIKLFNDVPLHRANFIHIVKRGFLNETCFYRVAKGFVIQGGNSDSFKMAKIKHRIGEFTLPAEFSDRHKHTYASVAMARVWKNNPNRRSTPYEFYIIVNPKGEPHLDGEHTVIGRVVKGMNVVKKINQVEVDRSEWPKQDICMTVEILD